MDSHPIPARASSWLIGRTLTFGRPYTVQTAARLDQKRRFAFVDLLCLRSPWALDSVGALIEDSDIEDLRVQRWSVARNARTIAGFAHRAPY